MTTTETTSRAEKSGSLVKLGLLLVVILGGFLLIRYSPLAAYVEPARLKSFFESISHTWWAPFAYILLYAVGTPIGLPGLVLTILGGVTFGVWPGSLYVLIGANIGANLAFGLARVLGRDFVSRFVKGPIDAIDRQLRDQGTMRIIQLRLIPVIPFNILNFVSGLSSVKHRSYLIGTLIGMIPAIYVYVNSASALVQLYFAGSGTQDEAALMAARQTALVNFSFAICLLALVSLIPVLYRKFIGKKAA